MDHPEAGPERPMHDDLDSPEAAPSTGRLRDPGSGTLALLSWLGILGVVGFIVLSQYLVSGAAPAEVSEEPSPTAGIYMLMSRYTVGAVELSKSAPGGEQQADDLKAQLLGQLESMTVTRDQRLRLALLGIDLDQPELVEAQLELASAPPEVIDDSDDAAEADEAAAVDITIPEYVFDDAQRIRDLQRGGVDALNAEDVAALRDHHGWFAEIALTSGLDPDDPARAAAVSAATRVMAALLALAILGIAGVVVGCVLLIVLIIRFVSGKSHMRYAPPSPGGSVYLETFAIFLIAFLGTQVLAETIFMLTGWDFGSALRWLLLLVLLWPLYRGAPRNQVKFALGWHRGEGVVKEIGAGFVGYLAGLPIVGLGVLLTFILSTVVALFTQGPSAPPSHPIVQEVSNSSLLNVISLYLLASVWAPLVEESMFRGALFHHLRGSMRALFAALLSGFIFAIIHPQGIVLVPPLMCLGFNFAMIREWRGSIIGPMFAHAMHNAVLVTVLIIAMG